MSLADLRAARDRSPRHVESTYPPGSYRLWPFLCHGPHCSALHCCWGWTPEEATAKARELSSREPWPLWPGCPVVNEQHARYLAGV